VGGEGCQDVEGWGVGRLGSWTFLFVLFFALICIRAFSLHVWHSCSMRWSSFALEERRHKSSTYRKTPTHRC